MGVGGGVHFSLFPKSKWLVAAAPSNVEIFGLLSLTKVNKKALQLGLW